MIGSFGSIAFTASAEQLRTFTGLGKQAEARFEEHTLIGKKSKLEFVGPGLEAVSFSIRLDAGMGVNPRDEITRITEIRDAGEAYPLVIGGWYLGDYVITNASESHRHHDNRGRLLVAEVNLSLKEYADD